MFITYMLVNKISVLKKKYTINNYTIFIIFEPLKTNNTPMNTNSFQLRHIGPDENEQKQMLDVIGIKSLRPIN